MLREEEKDRIRAEEIFRHEVRQKIETEATRHSRGKRLWSLLNSSFALWFLSSVVLGGLTAAVTSYQRSNNERLRRAEVERRLNIEISSRIFDALDALRLEQIQIENGRKTLVLSVYMDAINYLDSRVTDDNKEYDFSVYPEYKQRKFRSLIFELSEVVDPSALPALRDAEANYRKLESLSEQENNQGNYDSKPFDKSASLDAVKKSNDILEQLQKSPRWSAQF
ncbi:MAG: hypothetical protein WAK26_02640 [Terracidiphilus sp.]